jgi:hypothetical protein
MKVFEGFSPLDGRRQERLAQLTRAADDVRRELL